MVEKAAAISTFSPHGVPKTAENIAEWEYR
jgi:hypothetical protein